MPRPAIPGRYRPETKEALVRIPTIEFDTARRQLLGRLIGVFTGSAVALTLVQYAARRERSRQER